MNSSTTPGRRPAQTARRGHAGGTARREPATWLLQRVGRRGSALLAALLLTAALSGCQLIGGAQEPDPGDATEQTAPQDGPNAASDGGGASDAGGPSDGGGEVDDAAPVDYTPQNAQDCGPIFGTWRAVLADPDTETDCGTARSVLASYGSEDIRSGQQPQNRSGAGQGWSCETIVYGTSATEPRASSLWCTRGADAVLTVPADLPLLEGRYVYPRQHLYTMEDRTSPQWSFTTPSGKWFCGILDQARSPSDENQGEAGCRGDTFPEDQTTTEYPDSDGTPRTVNSIGMHAGGAPDTWINAEPRYYDGPVLDYGQVLYAYGFACTVDAAKGVTCTDSSHSFRVSSSEVELG